MLQVACLSFASDDGDDVPSCVFGSQSLFAQEPLGHKSASAREVTVPSLCRFVALTFSTMYNDGFPQ